MACACGCDADAPVAHAIAHAVAVDDVDAALAAGLLSRPRCPHCTPACRKAVEGTRAARVQALAARERHRARALRLARRDAELQARRRASADALDQYAVTGPAQAPAAATPASGVTPPAPPALPAAAAEALARAKARAASRHPR